MEQITSEGLKLASDLGQRYGFSQDAVVHMMRAMLRSRGGMAQFSHPEFAGSGQWMPGGMVMIGDMFNNALKARVDGLCQAVSASLASQTQLMPPGSFQSHLQSGVGIQQQSGGAGPIQSSGGSTQQAPATATPAPSGPTPLFVPDPRDSWWPAELGTPDATGQQNDLRYAVFSHAGRLVVDAGGRVSVYDTGGQQINGVSQQQGPGGAVVLATPSGTTSLSSFTAVAGMGQQSQQSSQGGAQQQHTSGGWGQQGQSSAATGMTPMQPMQPMQPMRFGGGMQPMEPLTFTPLNQENWWPAELGTPSATGSQNDLRYAVFADRGQLAVVRNGQLSLHALEGAAMTGISIGSSGEVLVSTSSGVVDLSSLPSLPVPGSPRKEEIAAVDAGPQATASPSSLPASAAESDVLATLERLGDLKAKGVLNEEEFAAKKAELLARL